MPRRPRSHGPQYLVSTRIAATSRDASAMSWGTGRAVPLGERRRRPCQRRCGRIRDREHDLRLDRRISGVGARLPQCHAGSFRLRPTAAFRWSHIARSPRRTGERWCEPRARTTPTAGDPTSAGRGVPLSTSPVRRGVCPDGGMTCAPPDRCGRGHRDGRRVAPPEPAAFLRKRLRGQSASADIVPVAAILGSVSPSAPRTSAGRRTESAVAIGGSFLAVASTSCVELILSDPGKWCRTGEEACAVVRSCGYGRLQALRAAARGSPSARRLPSIAEKCTNTEIVATELTMKETTSSRSSPYLG